MGLRSSDTSRELHEPAGVGDRVGYQQRREPHVGIRCRGQVGRRVGGKVVRHQPHGTKLDPNLVALELQLRQLVASAVNHKDLCRKRASPNPDA